MGTAGSGPVGGHKSCEKYPDDLREASKGGLTQGCIHNCTNYVVSKTAWPEAQMGTIFTVLFTQRRHFKSLSVQRGLLFLIHTKHCIH